MTNEQTLEKIKKMLDRSDFTAVKAERDRINTQIIPQLKCLFYGLKLRYKETGETVEIVDIGELFEHIQAKFPNGSLWWCLPGEFELPLTADSGKHNNTHWMAFMKMPNN